MNKRIIDQSPWVVNGFIIGISVSLFVCSGVMPLIKMVKNLELPEHEVLIFTVLFYGIIFFIAHSGVRTGTRRTKELISRSAFKHYSKAPPETKSTADRVKTVLWNTVTIISVTWVTPALIIYWAEPRHLNRAYSACCILFSLAGAIAYLLRTRKQNKSMANRILFFVGVCSGVFVVVSFLPDI